MLIGWIMLPFVVIYPLFYVALIHCWLTINCEFLLIIIAMRVDNSDGNRIDGA